MPSVKIGAEFFAKAKLDYSDWRQAWIREIFQNSADSGGSVIDFKFELINGVFVASVSDNGRGMSREVLEDKLFSLGSSGKDFKSGSVGGFGKAKELLYFAQNEFIIESNDLLCFGVGGEYTITGSPTPRKGTLSRVTIADAGLVEYWEFSAKDLIINSNFNGKVTVNGIEIKERSYCAAEVRKLRSGTMFFNSNVTRKDIIIFRVNGSPMFTKSIKNLAQGLIFELASPAQNLLTSNRDHLKTIPSCEVDAFVNELTIDKVSALIKKNAFTRFYKGKSGRLCRPGKSVKTVDFEVITDTYSKKVFSAEVIQSIYSQYNFVLSFAKAENLPEKWQLGTFCENALFVTWAWSVAIWDIFVMLRKEPDFDFGFVFDDSCEAQYNDSTFLINPADAQYKIKFTRTREDCCKILTLAAHEFVHHLGFGYHDERYSNALTDLMAKVVFNSPHTITRMLDKDAQAKLDYYDYESQRKLALEALSKKPIKKY